jgi:hypothetical protein
MCVEIADLCSEEFFAIFHAISALKKALVSQQEDTLRYSSTHSSNLTYMLSHFICPKNPSCHNNIQ